MARLILLLMIAAAIGLVTIFVATMVQGALASGQALVRDGDGRDVMAPTGLQKVAYAALLILLLGTVTGILGGA